jgi:hypothetical protein
MEFPSMMTAHLFLFRFRRSRATYYRELHGAEARRAIAGLPIVDRGGLLGLEHAMKERSLPWHTADGLVTTAPTISFAAGGGYD